MKTNGACFGLLISISGLLKRVAWVGGSGGKGGGGGGGGGGLSSR